MEDNPCNERTNPLGLLALRPSPSVTGGTITLHFVFLVLNNDFVIFYSRVWRVSNGIANTVKFCKDCTGRLWMTHAPLESLTFYDLKACNKDIIYRRSHTVAGRTAAIGDCMFQSHNQGDCDHSQPGLLLGIYHSLWEICTLDMVGVSPKQG